MERVIADIDRNDPRRKTLGFCPFPEVTEEQIMRSIDALKQNRHILRACFDFRKRHLTRTVCRNMAELFRMNSVIETISFPRGMTHGEFQPMAESLRENTSVTALFLQGCNISGRIGGEMVKDVLERNRCILILELDFNTWLGSEGASQIAQALRSRSGSTLKRLTLNNCNIGNEGMKELCLALTDASALEEINVQGNVITAAGCRVLARSLPHMKGLKRIFFSWYHGVTPDDFWALIRGILANRSLEEIWSDRNGAVFSEEQRRRWNACKTFVVARNEMSSRLDDFGITYAGCTTAAANRGNDDDDEATAMPVPLNLLLSWCNRRGRDGTEEDARASLIHHVVCTRTNDVFCQAVNVPRPGQTMT